MPVVALAAVLLVGGVGAIIALIDLARRETEPWFRVAWVTVILSFPLFGPAAYVMAERRPDVLGAWQRAAAAICVAVCAAALFWRVQDILPPFLIAFFLAALLDPLVTRLQARGVSRGRAVASIYLLSLLVIVLAVLMIAPGATQQMRDLTTNANVYASTFTAQADQWYAGHQKTLAGLGWTRRPSVMLTDRSSPLGDYAQRLLGSVKDAAMALASQVIWLVIIPLSLFYFLMDFQRLRAGLLAFVSERQRDGVDRITNEIVEVFSHYIRGLGIVCAMYAAAFVAVFGLFGLRYALFLGLAAGGLYAVPYVGPSITLSACVAISLSMGRSPALVAATAAVYLLVHVTFDYVITPRVVGGSVGLHPIVNVFALMAGAATFGVWGMLLAVPVAASIQKLLVNFYPGLFTSAASRPAPAVREPASPQPQA